MNNHDLTQFNQAIALAQSGHKPQAYQLLKSLLPTQLATADPNLLLWVAFTSPNLQESRACIHQAASLAPFDSNVIQAKAWLAEQEKAASPPVSAANSYAYKSAFPEPETLPELAPLSVQAAASSRPPLFSSTRGLLLIGLGVVAVILVAIIIISLASAPPTATGAAAAATPTSPAEDLGLPPPTQSTKGERSHPLAVAPNVVANRISAANAGSSQWSLYQFKEASRTLYGAKCVSEQVCYIGGDSGAFLSTGDGGQAWQYRRFDYQDLKNITCPTVTSCRIAMTNKGVGGYGYLLTDDGAKSWYWSSYYDTPEVVGNLGCPDTKNCYGVNGDKVLCLHGLTQSTYLLTCSLHSNYNLRSSYCFTNENCLAVGANGKIIGFNYSPQEVAKSWGDRVTGTNQDLVSIDCSKAGLCVVVGKNGTILISRNNGNNWQLIPSHTERTLNAVSCADALTCYAVGDGGTILFTSDGGGNWTAQPSGTNKNLYAVSAFSSKMCVAAGENGTVLVRNKAN